MPDKPRGTEAVFVAGVWNVFLSIYIMAKCPWLYFLWHTIKNTLYLIYRFFIFRKRKMEWFLSEFCYVVNYCTFFHVAICLLKRHVPALHFLNDILNPWGPTIFRILFAWSFGPVAASVVGFKNALVFHSFDHMTILAVHIGPPLVCYGLRFYAKELEDAFPDTFHLGIVDSPSWDDSLKELFVNPVVGYATWLGIYALFHFLLFASLLREQGMITMVTDLPFLASRPEAQRPLIYCAAHSFLSCLTFAFAQIWWRSHEAATVFLLTLLFVATWNGATYYFEVFGGDYAYERKKAKEAAAAAAAAAASSVVPGGEQKMKEK